MEEDFNFFKYLGINTGKPTGDTMGGEQSWMQPQPDRDYGSVMGDNGAYQQAQSSSAVPDTVNQLPEGNDAGGGGEKTLDAKGENWGGVIAAGTGLLGAVVQNHFAYKVHKKMLQIKKFEQEIGQMKIDGQRDANVRELYTKKEAAMEAAAVKAKISSEKMKANAANIKVAQAAKGFGGGASAGEQRQSLINMRAAQDIINLNEWTDVQKQVLNARAGIETNWIYATGANAITPMINFELVNYGEAALDMMNIYNNLKKGGNS